MRTAHWSLSLVAAVGLLAALLAGATIWLLLTDPVQGTEAVSAALSTGDVGPFLRAVGAVIYNVLIGLLQYL